MRRIVLMVLIMALWADSAFSIQFYPTSSKLEVRRGETIKCLLNVNNSDPKPVGCKISISGFEMLRDGKQLFEKANEKYSAVKWLSIKEPPTEVPPQSSKEVEVVITVPRNAEPGDYFACAFATTSSLSEARSSQGAGVSININLRMGSIFYITVLGQTIPKRAEISDIQTKVPTLGSKEKDVQISATLRNNCRLRLDAQGEVTIKNNVGRVFDRFILQGAGKGVKGEALVYPMGERDFFGTVGRPLPPGEYVAEVSFNYGSRARTTASAKFQISETFGKEQKAFLTLVVEPSLVKTEIPSGAFRALSLKVSNLDFEPMKVKAVPQAPWLEVEPTDFEIRSNRSKSLRIKVSVPAGEQSTMIGKILLQPERGKSVIVDIIVSPRKEQGK
jgi:hypothetical protein